MYLYHFHNFENMVEIDLCRGIEKGSPLDRPAVTVPEDLCRGILRRGPRTRELYEVYRWVYNVQ